MLRVGLIGAALALVAPSCARPEVHYAEFVRTLRYSAPPKSVRFVRVLTARPPSADFLEVGLIHATRTTFEDAMAAARLEAAIRGCDVLLLTSEGSARSRWGFIVDESMQLTGACLLRVSGAHRPPPLRRRATVVAASCSPPCRQGFDCGRDGTCTSACNPLCPSDRECMGHGSDASCVPVSVLAPQPAIPDP